MAKRKNNLTKLAKTKDSEKKENKNPDDLAKKKVEELLDEVKLKPQTEKQEDLIELDENPKDIKWLQNQVSVLTEQNEKLTVEANEAKENYKKLFQQFEVMKNGVNFDDNHDSSKMIPDSMLKNGIIEEFVSAQDNFLGLNPQRTRYKDMSIQHFLHRMLKRFEFLQEYKKI